VKGEKDAGEGFDEGVLDSDWLFGMASFAS
jgi:hypothetical protein